MSDVQDKPLLEPGIYRHYKGNEYNVIGVGKDTETEEWVVIYRPCYESDVSYWVRPYAMFAGTVLLEQGDVLRFVRIS
ncbi:MAG: DUF1653 domain-containing protein [Candidatus Saccharimonadales bacterium]